MHAANPILLAAWTLLACVLFWRGWLRWRRDRPANSAL